MQWVTDCGALGTGGAGGSGASLSGRPDKGGPSSGAPVFDDDEEMVVPADENFPRCPVSNEVFEPIWDNEEGDFMYRNAVKVLLTEEADPKLYSKSQNTHQPGVRYALIHKRMALDGWLEIGKAISLKDAMLLRKSNPIGMADYAAAGNVDEDEDDVFVILSERDTESNSAGGSRMEVAESKVEEYDPFSAESKQ